MPYAAFIEALQQESVYPATPNICDYIVKAGKIVKLKKNDILIGYDDNNDDIYFILDGIIRGAIVNKDGLERIIGFGECGTLIYSSQCYTLGQPSLICYTACCQTSMLKIAKKDFDRHIDEDHEFCRWFMGALSLAICYKDLRNEGLNGDALFKYKWMKEKRPEIIRVVPDKIIASYLNITEVHLSRIKSKIIKDSIS